MELVTEPVIHSAKQGGDFTRELQLLLRTLGVSDANMEKGEMRVEANISVSCTNELGTKVEVKNLNSFKSMEFAIDFETKRHIAIIEKGEQVKQETLGWDESKGKTFVQRSKETAHDYRYFPDPDIPKFLRSEIPEFSDSRLDEILPETPLFKRKKLAAYGLDEKQIEIIITHPQRSIFFDKALLASSDTVSPRLIANYFTSDVLSIIDSEDLPIENAHPDLFVELLTLVASNTLNSRVAKDLLKEVVFEGKKPLDLAESRGLLQEDNEEALLKIVDEIIATHQNVALEYTAGKEASMQFLIGQGMKMSKGSANPSVLLELFKKQLES
jgi:aspartyl-tRNA(Asn)/glutamyl-tRNA(Gln) amidotransferase subunit B